ncbi:hypothetical protein ACS8E2_12865 [Psychrobacter glaciei]|uniref:hypothetical protein n=1 Tax=Psychrobacter glaciei TaxID=619771 RepID=UPI003F46AC17
MPHIIWSLLWRLIIVLSYPTLLAMRQANAADSMNGQVATIDFVEQLAQTHPTSLIIGACMACWLLGSIIGALYPTPDDIKSVEIRPWLRLLICLTGGFAAFLWVLHDEGTLNLLTPLWVGGVAFVAPHLIQIIPTIVKARFGLGGKT